MNNLTTKATKQFKKSLEKCKSRNNDISLLQEVLQKIVKGEILDKKYRDHKLTNREERELHIQKDSITQSNKKLRQAIYILLKKNFNFNPNQTILFSKYLNRLLKIFI